MTDSPEETLALARTAAGAVRSLNHATLGGARLHLTDARASAAALAGDLDSARQQIAVHGTPARQEEGERS